MTSMNNNSLTDWQGSIDQKFVGNGLCAVPLLYMENHSLGEWFSIYKKPHTFVCGQYVGITYFHGPSPGNYRRRQ